MSTLSVETRTPTRQTKQKYWYRITHYLCPVCGHDDVYRERVYDKEAAGHVYETDTTCQCYYYQ